MTDSPIDTTDLTWLRGLAHAHEYSLFKRSAPTLLPLQEPEDAI